MLCRLDKFLGLTCKLTRQEAKAAIRKNQVLVDKVPANRPEQKINTDTQTICYQGKELHYEESVYYMLHKPAGVVSATKDNLHKTVLDLLAEEDVDGLFPVGRLDLDTEGLLLLTNDGELGHQLTSPAKHVAKQYEVLVDGELTETVCEIFRNGMDIGEKRLTRPAELTILETGAKSRALVTISEGKFHQVKRMFAHCGYAVLYLKRLKMGSLILDESLAPGEYRRLTAEELSGLKEGKQDV